LFRYGRSTFFVADSAETTGLKWAAPSTSAFIGCVAYVSNASTSFTGGTPLVINLPNEEIDTDGFHSTSTNTGRMTIPSGKNGKYLYVVQTDIQSISNGSYYIIYPRKNGSGLNGINRGFTQNAGGGSVAGGTIATVLDLVATDYLDFVWQIADTATREIWARVSLIYLGA
jgi:hypothetical protein